MDGGHTTTSTPFQLFFTICGLCKFFLSVHSIPYPSPSVSLSLPLSYAKCGGSTKLWCLHEKLTSVCDKTFHDLYMGWWLVLAAATEVTLALELACASSFVSLSVCVWVNEPQLCQNLFWVTIEKCMYILQM